MNHFKHASLAALSAFALSAPLAAANAADYLSMNVGWYDALRQRQDTGLFGLEYRFSELNYNVRPIVGGFVTGDGGVYGYAGINWDVALVPNQLYLVPNFAVGAYGNGNGQDLGGTLEFRSGIEVDYQLPNTQQIGVALNHLSNAGIYKHNTGEENVIVTYSIPVSTLAGMMR